MIRKMTLLVLFMVVLQLGQSFGWGMTGHRVVAEIAERHLTKKARRNIDKIIGHQKLAYWANWADFVKSDPSPEFKKLDKLHYINLPEGLSYADFDHVLKTNTAPNVYNALMQYETSFKDKNLSLDTQRLNLYMIIHLVGDAHQPMHVGRAEDLGGNKIEVSWFGAKSNLHRVWDSDLVDYEMYSYTEYATVLDILSKKEIENYQNSNLSEWLYESHKLSENLYDDAANNANFSYSYIYKYKYIMENQLLKGGLRLAKVLNTIFG